MVRKYVVGIVWLCVYVVGLYFLFGTQNRIYGSAALLGLFVLSPIVIVDRPKLTHPFVIPIGLLISISLMFWGNIFSILSVCVALGFHILLQQALVYTSRYKHNSVIFSTRGYISSGLWLWVLILSLVGPILAISKVHTLPFTCTDILTYTDRYLPTITNKTNPTTISSYLGTDFAPYAGFLDQIQTLSTTTLEQFMNDKALVQDKICMSVYTELEQKIQTPGFQASIILFVFLIVSPLMTIFLRVATIMCFVLWRLLLRTKIYTITQTMVPVEDII